MEISIVTNKAEDKPRRYTRYS